MRNELGGVLVKLLQYQVDVANLSSVTEYRRSCQRFGYNLSIEGVAVEKVGAVELLAVGLDHGDPVLLPLEYLHLVH